MVLLQPSECQLTDAEIIDLAPAGISKSVILKTINDLRPKTIGHWGFSIPKNKRDKRIYYYDQQFGHLVMKEFAGILRLLQQSSTDKDYLSAGVVAKRLKTSTKKLKEVIKDKIIHTGRRVPPKPNLDFYDRVYPYN